MARDKSKSLSTVQEQEEMTVLILRLKGDGDTLRKGFEAVSQALSAFAPATAAAPSRRILPGPGNVQALPDGTQSAVEGDGQEVVLDTENGDGNSAEPRESGTPRKYSTPKFLDDLKLDPETPWRDYAKEKNPQSEADKYLVAAAWLTEHGGNEKFTINHIFTCFRATGWPMQKDPSQPLRQMKSKKSFFEKLGRGIWKLTDPGLHEAKSLPRKAAA